MESADSISKHGFSKSKVPIFGAFIDYMDTNVEYLTTKSFTQAEKFNTRASRATLSASFMAFVCLLLGLACNVKLEVVLNNGKPLPHDLHLMLMSSSEKLYIEDIDLTQVMWSVEASDLLGTLTSCLLVWNSSNVRSPLSEYFFLPWLGMTLRGLFLRQGTTAAALIYTIAVVDGKVNPFFITSFCFLFLLEARLILEIVRLLRTRWEQRMISPDHLDIAFEVETIWTNDDERSIEVRNYVY